MMARFISFFFACLLFLFAFALNGAAQQPQPQQPAKGGATISGHVSLGDKDAADILVVLKKGGNDYSEDWGKVITKTKTDDKGNYQLTNVPAGSYNLTPQAAAYVVANAQERFFYFGAIGKAITVKESENLKDLDFTLVRGGVVTGRVTNSDGKPVINQRVVLWQIDEKGQKQALQSINSATDDRGIYRYYGLKKGRYAVSIGLDPAKSGSGMNGKTFYPMTFYPGTRNQDEAAIIEVEPGTETENIDIRVGPRAFSFEVSGKIINEETNQPLSKAYIGLTPVKDDKKENNFSYAGGGYSNEKGEFKINGVMAGKYRLGLLFQEKGSLYTPGVTVEVKDADVKDVIVKAKTGQSISGVVTFENMSTTQQSLKFENINITALIQNQDGLPVQSSTQVASDGSFTITGLRDGKVQFYMSLQKGFHMFRLERGGVTLKDGAIEIGPNESIQGIRAHVVYGNCVLRGEIKTEGGAPPSDSVSIVRLRRTDGAQVNAYGGMPDSLGRFMFDGLPPGEYEVTVGIYNKKIFTEPSMSEPKALISSKQTVTVSNGVEANVSLTVNINGGGTQQ